MSDLHHRRMNVIIEAALSSRPIFNPASLDHAPPPTFDESSLDYEALINEPAGADDVTAIYGSVGPRASWEMIP
jgi:hypothetical protein